MAGSFTMLNNKIESFNDLVRLIKFITDEIDVKLKNSHLVFFHIKNTPENNEKVMSFLFSKEFSAINVYTGPHKDEKSLYIQVQDTDSYGTAGPIKSSNLTWEEYGKIKKNYISITASLDTHHIFRLLEFFDEFPIKDLCNEYGWTRNSLNIKKTNTWPLSHPIDEEDNLEIQLSHDTIKLSFMIDGGMQKVLHKFLSLKFPTLEFVMDFDGNITSEGKIADISDFIPEKKIDFDNLKSNSNQYAIDNFSNEIIEHWKNQGTSHFSNK
jgi:hypothetical protein